MDIKTIIINQAKEEKSKGPNWQYTQERIQKIKANEHRLPKVYMPLVTSGIGYITGGYRKPGDTKELLVEWVKKDNFFEEEYLVSTIIDENFNFDQPWRIFEVPEDPVISVSDLSSILTELYSIFQATKEEPLLFEKPNNNNKGVVPYGV